MLTRRELLQAIASAAVLPWPGLIRERLTMRNVRVDITGTTDANGNAKIKIPLDNTGEYQNLKFAVGFTGAGTAEWAVLASGTQLTFGRGRRVTLGPEFITPQDVSSLIISVTGGPPSAAVLGSASGSAGTFYEMLSTWVPAPNTIALDSAAPIIRLGDVRATANQTLSKSFPLPPGALAIGFLVDSFGAVASPTLVQVSGDQTLFNYLVDFNPTGIHGAMLAGVDTSVTLQVTAGVSTAAHVFLIVWTSQAAVALNPFIENSPLPWQAPNQLPLAINANLAASGTATLVAANPSATIRLFDCALGIDTAVATGAVQLEDTSGAVIHLFNVSVNICNPFRGRGVALTTGVGVVIRNLMGANPAVMRGSLVYSQNT